LYAEIFAKVRSRNAKDTGEYCKYLLDNHDEYRDKVTLIPNGIFKFQIYNNPRLLKSLPIPIGTQIGNSGQICDLCASALSIKTVFELGIIIPVIVCIAQKIKLI
jgi:hypothetical protein